MANIPGLKKVGPFWHYSIQVNGQRAHGSTKATDLATARKVMEEKRRDLLHGQLNLQKKIPPTLNQVWESWWKANQTTFSQKHLVSAECRYRRWLKPSLGCVRVDHIKADAVMQVRSQLLEAGRSGRYANNTLELLRALIRFTIRVGDLDQLPFEVKPLRLQKKPRPTVPASRIPEFLAAVDSHAHSPHVAVMLKTMLGLGIRESEALGMRWEWFSPDQRTYTVGKAKGKEARVIPVPDWLWNAIFAMPKQRSEWVFPGEDGKHHHPQFCKKALQRVCKELGLGNVTQHRLRATFASLHAEAGTPISEIQGMLGHKDIATTLIYVETSLDAKRRSQDALCRKLGLA
ncbi:tyrosine-type recombinase/integrase [Mesoterricola silvestris]|uniref:Tyr recombinase domain-containing protein n=1 Tax=Mesoterricola silvestris TaxID=2927979 RepID=A0AA48KAE5_9BACT|nr:site-specific integrase [Mesoterricola silvestris]BDU74541.1 hypothetical protein METEAL_37150 [Mesoterricola silvestris]